MIRGEMAHPDICIAGAGIIGLPLARSLAQEGMRVIVLTSGAPMAEASTAAAGMLAVEDPDNPPELLALSRLSRSLYPEFLEELAQMSGQRVSFQTQRTLQLVRREEDSRDSSSGVAHDLLPQLTTRDDERTLLLDEQSLDPRELAWALVRAVAVHGPELRHETTVRRVLDRGDEVEVETASETIIAKQFVDCTGAWSLSTTISPALRVAPRKGQMLTIPTPPALARAELVVRSHDIYLVPRLHGARAGQCVVGATVEDAGFDRAVHASDLQVLLDRAARLLPELRSAEILDSWSGLRPATADLLPVLGRVTMDEQHPNLFIASGHYRNGILLAPGTAAVMTDLLLGRRPAVDVTPFTAARFGAAHD